MELQEFVKTTLKEVVTGVRKAQQALVEANHSEIGMGMAEINPSVGINTFGQPEVREGKHGGQLQVQQMEFTVAVTVADTQGTEGGGGIKVFSAFEFGGKMSDTTANTYY